MLTFGAHSNISYRLNVLSDKLVCVYVGYYLTALIVIFLSVLFSLMLCLRYWDFFSKDAKCIYPHAKCSDQVVDQLDLYERYYLFFHSSKILCHEMLTKQMWITCIGRAGYRDQSKNRQIFESHLVSVPGFGRTRNLSFASFYWVFFTHLQKIFARFKTYQCAFWTWLV